MFCFSYAFNSDRGDNAPCPCKGRDGRLYNLEFCSLVFKKAVFEHSGRKRSVS